MCRIITSEVDDNMDEQNNVDGIHKDDRLSLEGNLEQKDTLNNEQARSGYDQQRQWNQDSYAQQMQADGQEYQQRPQYSQLGQPQNYYGSSGRQPYQQQNYGPAGQQSYQHPPYGQPGQQSTPYDSPMGYVGYEYRQNVPVDVKKGSTHIPNLLNIVGMIMALITVFLPYAHMDSDVRTISGVFGIDVISVIVVAVLLVADIISAFMNKTVAYIIDLVISVIIGGALIFEFVLSLIDLGRLDKTVNAGLGFGAWFSVVTAILLLVSVPVWWAVSRKKAKSEKETAESAV